MNIKTVQRTAKRYGLRLKETAEDGEKVYLIETAQGQEIGAGNDLKMIYRYLPQLAQQASA